MSAGPSSPNARLNPLPKIETVRTDTVKELLGDPDSWPGLGTDCQCDDCQARNEVYEQLALDML
jgi:hypothetical protein